MAATYYCWRLKPKSLLFKWQECLYLEPKLLHSILSALLELTAVTGTDSGRLWAGDILALLSVSSVVGLRRATRLPSRQEKSPEFTGVVGKQILFHVIRESKILKRCWNGKKISEQVFYFDTDSK